ncbi:WD repeat-containing protein 44 [Impatiens glandulifera]|uniref:WD repeat-containing protein 44 n=1 Tax=Impatiens glandulifera TaxID=253017 RepID=UPI001FB0EAB6|nr:WD repeat-containing protein 44 [Impatiens glandulifera]
MLTLEEDIQEEIFFDSEDHYSTENQLEDGYEIWLKEPKSVEERRQSFLREMGFERLVESVGAVSAGCNSYTPVAVTGVDEISPVCCVRELNGEANCPVEDISNALPCLPSSACANDSTCIIPEECKSTTCTCVRERSILKNWWKQFVNRKSRTKQEDERAQSSRIKVNRKKKSRTDLSALYLGQEISAHKGLIWTMKFSPDGKYLASGGEDGFIRIWRVTQASRFTKETEEHQVNLSRKKTTNRGRVVVVPDKIFQVEKSPIHEFRGHTDGILDVAWSSNSNCILSASKDNSVRQWEMGSDECLAIYRHSNYVTCVQFNPWNGNYFITGSIDGKVRIWDLFERRVVDWADVRDQVTAICYQPDGKGLVAGTLKGFCRHYELSDNGLQLNSHIKGKKHKKITCIQFPPEDNSKIIVSSEDSEVRIINLNVTHNLEGLLLPPQRQRQMSAAFTSDGGHVISTRNNNSQVYMWKYDEPSSPSSSSSSSCSDRSSSSSSSGRSLSSCEYFSIHHGVSVAVPWRREMSEGAHEKRDGGGGGGGGGRRERFSLGNWFSMEGSSRVSATWPEEKLPKMGVVQNEDQDWDSVMLSAEEQLSETWGLVIVTAGWDGIIRTFHNFGLPAAAAAAAAATNI